MDILFADDGLHVLAHAGGPRPIRLFFPDQHDLPRSREAFGVYLHPDRYARERADAALRLVRWLTDPQGARDRRPRALGWPQRDHARLAAMLFALDLSAAGLGQREIVRQVLGAAPGPDWASHHARSALRRLLRDGARYLSGGYRDLLRPPKRQGRA